MKHPVYGVIKHKLIFLLFPGSNSLLNGCFPRSLEANLERRTTSFCFGSCKPIRLHAKTSRPSGTQCTKDCEWYDYLFRFVKHKTLARKFTPIVNRCELRPKFDAITIFGIHGIVFLFTRRDGLSVTHVWRLCDAKVWLAESVSVESFQLAINDIDLALTAGYPLDKVFKLYERKGECLQQLAKSVSKSVDEKKVFVEKAVEAYRC